jgi:hypothetical protein
MRAFLPSLEKESYEESSHQCLGHVRFGAMIELPCYILAEQNAYHVESYVCKVSYFQAYYISSLIFYLLGMFSKGIIARPLKSLN